MGHHYKISTNIVKTQISFKSWSVKICSFSLLRKCLSNKDELTFCKSIDNNHFDLKLLRETLGKYSKEFVKLLNFSDIHNVNLSIF